MTLAAAPTPNWRARWADLLGRLRVLNSEDEVEARLFAAFEQARAPQVLGFVNAHALNSVAHDAAFYTALRACDVLLRDGSGVALHYRLRGRRPGLNLNGTDLIPRLITRFDGSAIALLGTQQPYLGQAQQVIARRIAPRSARVSGRGIEAMHGFADVAAYVEQVRRQRPRLVVLGMGMPKQERVAVALREAIDFPCLIVCGGAILDFLGGKVSRAPPLLRRLGLEWAYRLALEPRRLFRRYVLGNPVFIVRSLWLLVCERLPGSR